MSEINTKLFRNVFKAGKTAFQLEMLPIAEKI